MDEGSSTKAADSPPVKKKGIQLANKVAYPRQEKGEGLKLPQILTVTRKREK